MRKTRKPGLQIPTPKADGLQIRQNSRSAVLPLNGVFYLVLLALMLVFAIYTATQFPYTYISMEGDDFWVLTWDFWHLKLATLPAITMWLSDWLTQFYSSLYIAACIETLALGAIGVLAHAALSPLLGRGWGRLLALLPPVLLGFYCTFSLSFLLQWVFFFTLLLIYKLIPNFKGKIVWSLICVPVGFLLMRTPLIAILLVCQTALAFKSYGAKKCAYWLLPMMILGFTPLAYSQQVAFIPFKERYTFWGTHFRPLTGLYNLEGEYVKKCVCLSDEQRWEELLYKEHVRRDAQRGKVVALRYALLAESALGTLPENISYYPIRDENQFLFPHEQDPVAQQFNRLFYLNLGVYDEAFHQAQEYSLLMPNGNCFSSLRQLVNYSIEEGEWDIAEKFLQVLSKSSCHKKFVEDSRLKIEDSKVKGKWSNGKCEVPLRADNFVGGYPLPIEMLRLARYYNDNKQEPQSPNYQSSNCQIKKMLDYAICAYMLRGDRNSFLIATKAFGIYKAEELPKAYQEFLEKYP